MLLKRLQLALIHTAVAMTLVPINSTLNRVMIFDLGISKTLFTLLAIFPYLLSPIQVAIGSFSPAWTATSGSNNGMPPRRITATLPSART